MFARLAALRPRSIYDVMAVIGCVAAVGTGTAYAANTVFSSDIVDGQVMNPDLGDHAVSESKIANGAVHTAKLPDGAVNSAKVLDESLTAADLATDSVQATEIADDSIDSGEIVDDSLFAADLAPNSVGASELAANAVTSGKVSNDSLTTSDIVGAQSNGSISLSGIPNGRCNQVTFNVGAAAVGQSVLVSTRAAIQNGIVLYGQRVASAGHVEVDACNFSGGAMTPISDFPVRVVTLG